MGFFGRILCAMEKEGKEVTDFPHSRVQVPSVCGMLGKTPQRLWKDTTPAILVREAGHLERQIASTKCQMRNIRSAVGWQKTMVTREGFLEEVGFN